MSDTLGNGRDMSIEAMAARLERAHAKLAELCRNPRSFRMSIPVRADDTDITIGVALRDFDHMLAKLGARTADSPEPGGER